MEPCVGCLSTVDRSGFGLGFEWEVFLLIRMNSCLCKPGWDGPIWIGLFTSATPSVGNWHHMSSRWTSGPGSAHLSLQKGQATFRGSTLVPFTENLQNFSFIDAEQKIIFQNLALKLYRYDKTLQLY